MKPCRGGRSRSSGRLELAAEPWAGCGVTDDRLFSLLPRFRSLATTSMVAEASSVMVMSSGGLRFVVDRRLPVEVHGAGESSEALPGAGDRVGEGVIAVVVGGRLVGDAVVGDRRLAVRRRVDALEGEGPAAGR